MGRYLNLSDDVSLLRTRDRQLIAEYRDSACEPRSAPLEDVDVVVLDTLQGLNLDLHLLRALVAQGTALVVSDDKRLPAGILLPLHGTTRHGAVLATQIAMSQPRRKRAWQALVRGKLHSQAVVLGERDPRSQRLLAMARRIRSGDPDNLEAQAARIYWPRLFVGGERREPRNGTGLNASLDYGYAVLRALLARAVVAAGLHPAIAVMHSARTNALALVDDLIEPLRPLVDRRVFAVVPTDASALTPVLKREIVGFIRETVEFAGRRGPLTEVVERFADGYRRYAEGVVDVLTTPSLAPSD